MTDQRSMLSGGWRGLLPGGADIAAWVVADRATRRAMDEVVVTLGHRAAVERLARECANRGNAQRAGSLFEVMHAVAFDRHAARLGEAIRARPLDWVNGPRNGAADVRFVGAGAGGEAQMKLYRDAVLAARKLANAKYTGMQRIVASDKIEEINRVLDKALSRSPENINYADYQDAQAHLSDQLVSGRIHSNPISYQQTQNAARDPNRWIQRQIGQTAGREIAAAAASAALISGLVSTASAAARARAAETSAGVAILTSTGAIARGVVRSGGTTALTHGLCIGAQAGSLPSTLATGPAAALIADAAWEVGEAGLAFARGQIDAGELAARGVRATARGGLAWVGGAIGQTILPVPVVGALLGGIVGQTIGTIVAQGLQAAIVAARADGCDPHLLAVLEAEATTTAATTAFLEGQTEALSREHHATPTDTFLPGLRDARLTLSTAQPVQATLTLTKVTEIYSDQPIFTTVDEFELWMADRNITLTLNPNW